MEHLVIDAGALIKGISMEKVAKQYWTTQDVMDEIRDKKSRGFLARLPFTLTVKVPCDDSVASIIAFARKTGDFAFLSMADIRILALTYMLEKQSKESISHLRTEPSPHSLILRGGQTSTTTRAENQPMGTCFYFQSPTGCPYGDECKFPHVKKETAVCDDVEAQEPLSEDFIVVEENEASIAGNEASIAENEASVVENEASIVVDFPVVEEEASCVEETSRLDSINEVPVLESLVEQMSTLNCTSRILGGYAPSSKADEEECTQEWISVGNVDEYMMSPFGTGAETTPVEEEAVVGCVTTDYSMQNVLLQMGLHLFSVEGRVIRRLKQWILQCQACFHLVRQLEKRFCPQCGNATLDRIACRIDDSGDVTLYSRVNRPINRRGTKFSIPKPKVGGRRTTGLVLREDQLMMGVCLQKTRQKGKKVHCAFGEHVSQELGLNRRDSSDIPIGYGRKNPNAQKGRERRGKKKRS